MDILMISPPLSVNERYSADTGKVGGNLPPLGIAQLAAVLIEKGYSVKLIDALALDMSSKDILEYIKRDDPKVIGFSSITATFYRVRELAEKIKMDFPDKLVIIGGHHATITAKETIQNKCFDLLVYGEGELILLDIMDKYKKSNYDYKTFIRDYKLLSSIKGAAYRKGKKVIINAPRELIQDLDKLPFPARHLLPMKKYIPLPNQYKRKPVVHITAIRGCPFNCAFCSNNAIFGRRIRAKSPERLVEEIKYVIKKYGAKEISFWDDSITINRKWLMDFCDLLIKDKIDITWTAYSRVDRVDEELLRKMKKAGCWNLFFGYESGCQELLDNIKKGITLEQIRRANALCKKVGIEIRASFMLALPGETPKLAQKTIDFAKELNPDYVQFEVTTPYPATELFYMAKDYGTVLHKDFSKYSMWEPVFIPHGYKDAEQVRKTSRRAMREFYLRPRYILSRIMKINSFEDIVRYAKGLRFIIGFTK